MGPRERKEREKEQRKEDIIRAGERLFLAKGIHGSTMEEIARECELSKGTIYLYFPSKEALYLTIMQRALYSLYELFRDSQVGVTDPVERFVAIKNAYLRFYNDYTEHFRILSTITDHVSSMNDYKDLMESLGTTQRKIWEVMISGIVDGMNRGLIKNDTDPIEVSFSLYLMSTSVIRMMDHVNTFAHKEEDGWIFGGIDFLSMLDKNGYRIVRSILTEEYAKQLGM